MSLHLEGGDSLLVQAGVCAKLFLVRCMIIFKSAWRGEVRRMEWMDRRKEILLPFLALCVCSLLMYLKYNQLQISDMLDFRLRIFFWAEREEMVNIQD